MTDPLAIAAIVAGVYVVACVTTFVAYGVDKRAARRDRRRVSERNLHLLEACGGWPAGAVARRYFRHKRANPACVRASLRIITAHSLAWAAVVTVAIVVIAR